MCDSWPGLSGHEFFVPGRMMEGISGQPCSGADVSEQSISLCSCGASHIRPTAFCSIAAEECNILLHRCRRSAAICSIVARECSIAAGVYGIRQLQNGQLLGNYCDESGLSDDTVVSKKVVKHCVSVTTVTSE